MAANLSQRLLASRNLHLGGAVTIFFGLKFALGLALIGISSEFLPISGFVTFSQLFLFFALLSTISAAGVQNGLTRQIAAAKGDAADEQRSAAAALHIWVLASLLLLVLVTLLRGSVSKVLVGDTTLAGIVPIVALAGAGGGFGILACAILNGRRRAATSLLLQSAGLVLGGLLCIWRLLLGDAIGAILGYTAGPLLTSALAAVVVRRAGIRFSRTGEGHWREVRLLIGYSLAFLAIALIMPCTLFALRLVYREAFGTDLLGYWLAANRVLDVTSQILGLYMAQIFLPQAAQTAEPGRVRRLLVQTMAIGSAVMLGGWVTFVVAAPFFVSTFLSAAYLPAIPFISSYLLGDGLRVASSIAIHFMLARGRLIASVSIEIGTATLLAAYVLLLVHIGRSEAPYWAYPAAYATMALVLIPALFWCTERASGMFQHRSRK